MNSLYFDNGSVGDKLDFNNNPKELVARRRAEVERKIKFILGQHQLGLLVTELSVDAHIGIGKPKVADLFPKTYDSGSS